MDKCSKKEMERGWKTVPDMPYDPEDVERAKMEKEYPWMKSETEGGFAGRPKGWER